MAAFTLSDLTLNEYSQLARMIGGDPGSAMVDPRSKLGAEALAGLLVLRSRRDGDFAITLEQVMRLGFLEVQTRLGLIGGDETSSGDDDEDDQSAEELAAASAEEAIGAAVDPTVPPGSRGSASPPAPRRRRSATAREQR